MLKSKKHQQRTLFVIALVLGFSLTVGFALKALNENINVFFTPTEINIGPPDSGQVIRLGGMVLTGSVTRTDDLMNVFTLTDFEHETVVRFKGILPDLFREGQGIIARGVLNADNVFVADEVLAKHDENYMPAEIADAMKASGKMDTEFKP